jgi:acylphosphatase
MKDRVHLYVSGRVQGVFFRARTRERAHALHLSGWVRNLPDGRVEIVAEGRKEALEALIAWARVGPSAAHVDDLAIRWEPPTQAETGFSIRA